MLPDSKSRASPGPAHPEPHQDITRGKFQALLVKEFLEPLEDLTLDDGAPQTRLGFELDADDQGRVVKRHHARTHDRPQQVWPQLFILLDFLVDSFHDFADLIDVRVEKGRESPETGNVVIAGEGDRCSQLAKGYVMQHSH